MCRTFFLSPNIIITLPSLIRIQNVDYKPIVFLPPVHASVSKIFLSSVWYPTVPFSNPGINSVPQSPNTTPIPSLRVSPPSRIITFKRNNFASEQNFDVDRSGRSSNQPRHVTPWRITKWEITWPLRTFARKSSNIDFFLKLSPVWDYGLLMSFRRYDVQTITQNLRNRASLLHTDKVPVCAKSL